jgi:hypothetical protein
VRAISCTLLAGALVAVLGVSPAARADTAHQLLDVDYRRSPMPLAKLVPALRARALSKSAEHAAVCAPIAELGATRLCFFKTKRGMNAALNRISELVETKRGLLSDREHATNPRNDNIDGHDLKWRDIARALKTHDRERKRATADAAPAGQRWAIAVERDFREQYLEPQLKRGKGGVLLGLAARGDDGALHHEVLHATYFERAAYRRVVRLFYKRRLSRAQRAAIETRLASVEYDVKDEALVLNEVQAYLLMTGADKELLGEWADLAPALRRALDAHGTSPPSLDGG